MLSQYAAEVEARYEQEKVRRQAERAHLVHSAATDPTGRRWRVRFRIRRLPAIRQLGPLRVPWFLWG
jgi:hypothetical protein